MARECSRCSTYILYREDAHRLDDFWEEVTRNSWGDRLHLDALI